LSDKIITLQYSHVVWYDIDMCSGGYMLHKIIHRNEETPSSTQQLRKAEYSSPISLTRCNSEHSYYKPLLWALFSNKISLI